MLRFKLLFRNAFKILPWMVVSLLCACSDESSVQAELIVSPSALSRGATHEISVVSDKSFDQKVTLTIAPLSGIANSIAILVINSVLIANPKVSFEVDEKGGNNMQALLDSMGGAAPQGEAGAEEPAGEEMKLIIDQFAFTGGQVSVDSPALQGESKMLKLPGIRMSGIGRKQGGVTPNVVAEKIVKELVNEVIKAAAKAEVDKAIEEKKKGLLDRLKGEG